MKLCYRGIPYSYEPPEVKAVPTGFSGKYRGAAYPIQQLIPESTESMARPVRNLKYRGVAYQIGQPVREAAPALENIPTITVTVLSEQIVVLGESQHLAKTHS